jgi:hypothetical protein
MVAPDQRSPLVRGRSSAARRRCTALALVAIVPGLAACGGDKHASASSRPAVLTPSSLALVADKTVAKGGVRVSLDQTTTIGGQAIPSTASGFVDTAHHRGEMTLQMDLSQLPGGAEAGGKTEQHMIYDGTALYMSSPLFTRLLPPGKKWMKIDFAELGKQAGIDLGALMQGSNQDPTQALQYLKAASGDIVRVGTETVRGVPTTHYKATIDFNKVPDAMPAGQREAVRKSIQQIIKLAGTSRAPMEVWIGDDGIAHRIADTITTKTAGQSVKVTQRIELYDFGAKVDVKIPSAGETADPSELGGLSQGGDSSSSVVPG